MVPFTADHWLDEVSETDLEDDDAYCQAVSVGILLNGEMRPLCHYGCKDAAQKEPVILLKEDAEVSDVPIPSEREHATVRLCGHHAGMYQAARFPSKCAKATCYREAKGTKDGVRLCSQHLVPGDSKPTIVELSHKSRGFFSRMNDATGLWRKRSRSRTPDGPGRVKF